MNLILAMTVHGRINGGDPFGDLFFMIPLGVFALAVVLILWVLFWPHKVERYEPPTWFDPRDVGTVSELNDPPAQFILVLDGMKYSTLHYKCLECGDNGWMSVTEGIVTHGTETACRHSGKVFKLPIVTLEAIVQTKQNK